MSAPGGILMAKIIMPDDGRRRRRPTSRIVLPEGRISAEGPAAITEGEKPHEVAVAEAFEDGHKAANIIEAAAQGAQTGVKLAVAVGAMVLAFVALVALANGMLGGSAAGSAIPSSRSRACSATLFAPVMFLLGIPWDEAQVAGGLFGTKIVLNEFVAFIDLGAMEPGALSARTPGDRHLRAVRLRQLQLDRDPDGGDRRARAQPAAGDRQARPARRSPPARWPI